jgi:cellobiose-specific phosphotransferase system component IIC
MITSRAEAYPLTQISIEQNDEIDNTRQKREDKESSTVSLSRAWKDRLVNVAVKTFFTLLVVGGIGTTIGYAVSLAVNSNNSDSRNVTKFSGTIPFGYKIHGVGLETNTVSYKN